MRSIQKRLATQLVKVSCALTLLASPMLLIESKPLNTLEQVQAQGVLRVISINGPETFYEDTDEGLDGYEYHLAKAFAKELGVALEIVPAANFGEVLDQTEQGRNVHMAASGLIVTPARQQRLAFSDAYMTIHQQLIYRTGTERPTELAELFGRKIMVMADSSEAERLREIGTQYPKLEWTASSDYNSMDLIEQVHAGETDFALVKSNAFTISQHVYPRARIAYTFPDVQQLAWAFPQQTDNSLLNAANRFLAKASDSGLLAKLEQHHFNQPTPVDTGGALAYSSRIKKRLPRWESLLQEAARSNEIDWLMLAAVSYQESHWNPKAKSPTGVRGMMMLTRNTARELGVENRLDPAQSIEGGARYIRKLFDRMPDAVQGPDRMWMTLAAYNVGYGHLMDARQLAQEAGYNPDSWDDVAQHLPLLAKRKYYKLTRHGYARGWEPVSYVNNIRQFYTILAWHKQVEQRRIAMASNGPLLSVNSSEINTLRSSSL